MSREEDFRARMAADTTLATILTGGIYTRENVGVEGITRETVPSAFDANGYLKPCALIKQRGNIPDGILRDEITQQTSTAQVVEVWLYEDRGYTAIDLALAHIYRLFQGHQFTGTSASLPVGWINTLDRERDTGALKGASLARIDFVVFSIRS